MDNQLSYIEQEGKKLLHEVSVYQEHTVMFWIFTFMGVLIIAWLIKLVANVEGKPSHVAALLTMSIFIAAIIISGGIVINRDYTKLDTVEKEFIATKLKPYLKQLPKEKYEVKLIGEVGEYQMHWYVSYTEVIYKNHEGKFEKAIWGVTPNFSKAVKKTLKPGEEMYMLVKSAPNSEILRHFDVYKGFFNPEIYVPTDYNAEQSITYEDIAKITK